MAELVFRNTDGRTYTYSDQNELYRVLNEAGRSDFSWFHFSGGDNRIAMLPGEGDGINIASDGGYFHIVNISSASCISACISNNTALESDYIDMELSKNKIDRIRVMTVPMDKTDQGADEVLSMHKRISIISESMKISKSPSGNGYWFPLTNIRTIDTMSRETTFGSYEIMPTYSSSIFARGQGTFENKIAFGRPVFSSLFSIQFTHGSYSGLLDTLNADCVLNYVSKTRVVSVEQLYLHKEEVLGYTDVTSSTRLTSTSQGIQKLYWSNGVYIHSGNTMLKDLTTTYTSSLSREYSMSFLSLPKGEDRWDNGNNFYLSGYSLYGQEISSYRKLVSETEARVFLSVDPSFDLSTTFIDGKPLMDFKPFVTCTSFRATANLIYQWDDRFLPFERYRLASYLIGNYIDSGWSTNSYDNVAASNNKYETFSFRSFPSEYSIYASELLGTLLHYFDSRVQASVSETYITSDKTVKNEELVLNDDIIVLKFVSNYKTY